MSYTPTTWIDGDTITAAKLNKMEQGITDAGSGGGGGASVVVANITRTHVGQDDRLELDKTWGECFAALPLLMAKEISGGSVRCHSFFKSEVVEASDPDPSYFEITFDGGDMTFYADGADLNDYPDNGVS